MGFEIVRWRVADWKTLPLAEGEVAIWWLGQAGFAVRSRSGCFLVDPYLSDSLAKKYAGTKYPHLRMMPPPAGPELFAEVDWVFCTHRHTDHMDPETLGIISGGGRARFVVPRSAMDHATGKVGLEFSRLIPVNAGETVALSPGVSVSALPSAHEKLEVNERGEYSALGYVIKADGVSLYHAGDGIPYEGLEDRLAGAGRIDLALLPVNGRDAQRTAGGVPGNFTIDEALELCSKVSAGRMIVAHFGMFDFNTVDPVWLRKSIKEAGMGGCVAVPEVDVAYKIGRGARRGMEHGAK